MLNTKQCTSCSQVKEYHQFYKSRGKAFGRCMDCYRQKMRERYTLRRTEILAKSQAIRDQRLAIRTMELA